MKITVDVRVPRWMKRLSWKMRGAIVAAVFAVVAVPVALAAHQFGDVPNDQAFHAQIDAIADAGITTGCGGGNYCPSEFVRRDAMAAFMHRGFGRVGTDAFAATVTETSDSALATVGSITITPGVPAGALVGANGFLHGHASVNIIAPASGCPCEYWAALFDLTESDYFNGFYSRVSVGNSEVGHMSVSGAASADIVGSHTVQLRVFRFSGTGTGAVASGDFTVQYSPFGSEGGDILSVDGSGIAASGDGATPR